MTSSPQLARLVVAALATHLDHVVICPGSRNSALSLELLAREDIRVHTRIDERSAAFLALGIARATGQPVGVVTTSGTAVVNCAPAMVEAAYSHTPLVVISADRPARLQGTGANQTINQQDIFASAGVPTTTIAHEGEVAFLHQALRRGQAHLNIALDTPLVAGLPAPAGGAVKQRFRPPFHDHGTATLDLSRNTLVIAGDEAWEVPGLEDVPTIAEPTAPAPFVPVHPLAAGIFAHEQVSAEGYVVRTKPEQVVVVGHPTLHRGVLALIQDPDIELVVLSRTDTVTDLGRGERTVASNLKTTGAPTKAWLEICAAASDLAAQAVRNTLAEDHGFTGLHAAAAVADTLGTGDTLLLGSSNPVRDASLVGLPFPGVDTIAARGAAGIDGTVSQAIGVALAVQAANREEVRAPRTVALMGDVTFLHDAPGLLIGPDSPLPENLTIVVANDNGGGIFHTLEVGESQYAPSFERAFGTPHNVDVEALAQAYDVEYMRAENLQELITSLMDTTEVAGFRIIEATTSREGLRELHKQLQAQVRMGSMG
ncbi:2-succinyl-5-enolpyruvyl-6-hydroxy-3-cyclohexene-1-carboxylic-acid synthase [Corynebacterium kozikiae]|uniref:2-succinyl-5-enolpyruvyl-6-hydroxy-3- cyclohexene-1-carboxylic-acid synthase n=1 Tax=Corynebacterium kozikiae TaxID=2968469 RepID=UPI00211C4DD4|nr:2-succinyl-5-enolpyruvyl-6-hydroxy-3-cyclohexene-1-carboxylic-acid synthase [Corynebacterium sp. 76QC2CO]MCQ9342636.1 2-succinyl-5-enolpyruvyl-6-hydroxy-3-cyclohexene-1-carboxylic-acid synthase [Corynebacterium sp. 76QC2CO]